MNNNATDKNKKTLDVTSIMFPCVNDEIHCLPLDFFSKFNALFEEHRKKAQTALVLSSKINPLTPQNIEKKEHYLNEYLSHMVSYSVMCSALMTWLKREETETLEGPVSLQKTKTIGDFLDYLRDFGNSATKSVDDAVQDFQKPFMLKGKGFSALSLLVNIAREIKLEVDMCQEEKETSFEDAMMDVFSRSLIVKRPKLAHALMQEGKKLYLENLSASPTIIVLPHNSTHSLPSVPENQRPRKN